jgi:hypothetical protein
MDGAAGEAPPEEGAEAGAPLWRDEEPEVAGDEAADVAEELVIEPEEALVEAAEPAEAAAKEEKESAHEPAPLPVESLDACPNCGSPMRGKEALVCMRCGYDIKHLKVIETETEKEEPAKAAPRKGKAAAARDEADEQRPLTRRGLGGVRFPLALAAIGTTALTIGYLLGFRGLFPPTDVMTTEGEQLPPIAWSARFLELGRFPVLAGIWTLCGLGALFAGSWMFGRPLGDLRVAAARMLGIIVLVFCAQFIPIQDKVLSFAAEAAMSLLAFFLLSMLFFRLKPRDAGTVMAMAIVSFVVLYLGAQLLTWAV